MGGLQAAQHSKLHPSDLGATMCVREGSEMLPKAQHWMRLQWLPAASIVCETQCGARINTLACSI